MIKKLTYFILWISSFQGFAQEALPIKNIGFSLSQTVFGTDNKDHIYLASDRGQVKKYNLQGKELANFAPNRILKIDQIHTEQGLKVLAYSSEQQEGIWLDRQLNLISEFSIPSPVNGFVSHVCLGSDNSIWMINNSKQTIIKWDMRQGQVIFESSLQNFLNSDPSSTSEVKALKSNRHLLYMEMSNGDIFIFNHQGQLYQKLSVAENINFYFYDDFLLLEEPSRIKRFDLKSSEEEILMAKKGDQMVFVGRRFYLSESNNALMINILPLKKTKSD
jgi:hypothetical protein